MMGLMRSVRFLRRLVWMACVATLGMVVVVFLSLVSGTGRIPAHERVDMPVPPAEHRETHRGLDEYLDTITRGELSEENRAVPVEIVADDPSGLFTLVSVFLVQAERENRGFAVIVYRQDEALYAEGTMLPEEYLLVNVKADSVMLQKGTKRWILHRSGRTEPVVLEEEPVRTSPETPPGIMFGVHDAEISETEEYEDPSGAPGERYEIAPSLVDRTLKNLHKLLHDVKIEARTSGTDEHMTGIRIYPKDGSLLRRFGFEGGDVIRAVNGKVLVRIPDVMSLLKEYQKNPPKTLKLLVERGGKISVKHINVRDDTANPD
jgi:type II secretory pathway component PulC